jgi:hypothetical protein
MLKYSRHMACAKLLRVGRAMPTRRHRGLLREPQPPPADRHWDVHCRLTPARSLDCISHPLFFLLVT